MPDFQTYVLPVLLGIDATALIFLGKAFFYDVFLPRYRKLTYRGHIIHGTWDAEFPARHDPELLCHESIKIKQFADKVHGEIDYSETRKEDNALVRRKRFRFEGTYVDRILSASYANVHQNQIGRGTFCLRSTADDVLDGKYSWEDPDSKEIEADKYVWEKVTD